MKPKENVIYIYICIFLIYILVILAFSFIIGIFIDESSKESVFKIESIKNPHNLNITSQLNTQRSSNFGYAILDINFLDLNCSINHSLKLFEHDNNRSVLSIENIYSKTNLEYLDLYLDEKRYRLEIDVFNDLNASYKYEAIFYPYVYMVK